MSSVPVRLSFKPSEPFKPSQASQPSRWPLLALLVLALTGWVRPAAAEDTRPSEIPYDTPGNIPQLSPDYRQTSHKVVLITDDSISPRSVNLKEGQLVAWISYASNPTEIVFEREVARDMICHSLVNFSIVEDELKSAPIQPGEFASFCELKPGRYEYILKRPSLGMTSPHHQAQSRLRGEIIVGVGRVEDTGKGAKKKKQ